MTKRRGRRRKQLNGLTVKTERQSTRSYSVENSLWMRLWFCRDRLRHDNDDDDDDDDDNNNNNNNTMHHYCKLRFLHRTVPRTGPHNQLTLLCRVLISLIVTIKKLCASYTGWKSLVSNVSEDSLVGLIVN